MPPTHRAGGVRAHALTRGGALAAFAVGALTFAAGTGGTALMLLAFFVTSVALSRVGRARKRGWSTSARAARATPRKCSPTAAWRRHASRSGRCRPQFRDARSWFVAFAGAYAAATADTWGTEIGTLAPQPPRSILTGKPLAAGLSGGVSAPGTAAEVAGAVLIALLAPVALLLAVPGLPITLRTLAAAILPVFIGGFGGAMVDSLLGATLQQRRWCPACERECETDLHGCGTATTLHRGLAWLTNDGVNFAATRVGRAAGRCNLATAARG